MWSLPGDVECVPVERRPFVDKVAKLFSLSACQSSLPTFPSSVIAFGCSAAQTRPLSKCESRSAYTLQACTCHAVVYNCVTSVILQQYTWTNAKSNEPQRASEHPVTTPQDAAGGA